MKRFIFSALALAAVAVGCTKSEMIVKPNSVGSPISISPYLGRTVETKAESVDLAYLQGTGYGFHVNAFLHVAGAEPVDAAFAAPYMNKDVYWVSNGTVAYFPNESATTKVIFSNAAEKPAVPANVESETFNCPGGWIDDLPENTTEYRWYTMYTKGNNVWTAGEVLEIKRHNDGSWEYDGVTYWPDANSSNKLAFSAYGVKTYTATAEDQKTWSNTSSCSISTDNKKLTFTVNDVVAYQHDLIVAPYQSGKSIDANASNTNVFLNFQHMLSRVGFQLLANQTNDNVEIKITRLELKGKFPKQGEVNLIETSPKITATTATEFASSYKLLESSSSTWFSATSQTFENVQDALQIYANNATSVKDITGKITVTAADNTNSKNCYMMIIPCASATDKFSIEVDYTLTDADPQTAIVSLPESWAFEAGKAYNFVLKVSTSAIGFFVETSDWLTGQVNDSYTLTPEVTTNNN